MLNAEPVKSKHLLADGQHQIITEIMGVDGNEKKLALLRYTYIIGNNSFVKRKEVLFNGTTEWIQRHEYKYVRNAGS
jgi:hypothetical protein